MKTLFGLCLVALLAAALDAGQASSLQPKRNTIFHLNEVSGTTTQDSVGLATATLKNGASFVSGRFGTAVECDGVNDYVEIGGVNIFTMQAPFSISGWVFPKGSSVDGFNCVFCAPGIRMGLYYDGNFRVGLRHYDGNIDNDTVAPSTTAIPTFHWSHVAASKDAGGQVFLYVNGKKVTQIRHANAISYTGPNQTNFGICSPDGVGELLVGTVDDVVISSVAAWTDAEVRALYNTGINSHAQRVIP